SRGSPTKRYAFASAAGPMKSGAASIERHEETQAPHWMPGIDWVMATSAPGPMNAGSASIERHEETQAPHWMQAIDWVMSIIGSGGTTYSRSGGSPWGSSQGVTRRILGQCVGAMSVTRSLV